MIVHYIQRGAKVMVTAQYDAASARAREVRIRTRILYVQARMDLLSLK
jgi:hypothetical protein